MVFSFCLRRFSALKCRSAPSQLYILSHYNNIIPHLSNFVKTCGAGNVYNFNKNLTYQFGRFVQKNFPKYQKLQISLYNLFKFINLRFVKFVQRLIYWQIKGAVLYIYIYISHSIIPHLPTFVNRSCAHALSKLDMTELNFVNILDKKIHYTTLFKRYPLK